MAVEGGEGGGGAAGGLAMPGAGARGAGPPAGAAGGLAEAQVLAEAGTFELGLVSTLAVRRKGVRRLLGLERCEALAELDLSGNLIERVEGLERAVKLRKLVLCGNRLRSVEGLECCVSLEHLLLQGNALEDLSWLGHLQGLPALKSLYLRNVDGSQANPVCAWEDYRAQVLKALPGLRNLDGERQPVNVGYRDEAEALERAAGGRRAGGGAGGGGAGSGWFPPNSWGPPKAGPVPKWELDAKQLRAVLAECRTLQIAAKKEIERAIQKSLLIAI